MRIDSQGRPDGPAYHALNPEVREAMKRRVTDALSQLKAGEPGGAGLVIRLGPGPTLLGTPDTGLDDATYQKFTHDTFGPETAREIPGVESTDPDRFAVRSTYLAGKGRMPWLSWRSKEIAALYAELNATMRANRAGCASRGRHAGPGRRPGRHRGQTRGSCGPAALASRGAASGSISRPGRADLGSPLVLRGTALSTEALSHDLATSPDLDSLVASRPHRGLLLSIGGEAAACDSGGTAPAAEAPEGRLPQPSPPDSPAPDPERLGRPNDRQHRPGHRPARAELAGLAHRTALGRRPGRRRTARARTRGARLHSGSSSPKRPPPARKNGSAISHACSALFRPRRHRPSLPADGLSKPFGVVVRSLDDSAQTFLEIANNSPYPVRLAGQLDLPAAASIEDLGRGVRLNSMPQADGSNLVLDLLPYGVAAIRIAAPEVKLSAVNSYPSDAVMTGMRTRFNELSAQLARLNHGLSADAGRAGEFRLRAGREHQGARPCNSPMSSPEPAPRQRQE